VVASACVLKKMCVCVCCCGDSAKPAFFMDGSRAPLFEVDIRTGLLQNTDSGTPMAQVIPFHVY
jgi:hypothetical protein